MKNEYERAAEILEAAADGFESGRYGLAKGISRYGSPATGMSYCSTGALYHEAGLFGANDIERATDAFYQAEAQLAETVGVDHRWFESCGKTVHTSHVPRWNDEPERTRAEVIDKMKEAAKELRNQA